MSRSADYPLLTSFSDAGDEGIIDEILRRFDASTLNKWCVEFGAWDGIYLSNTCNLIKNHRYRAVLIEADAQKYKELCANHPSSDVIKLCQFVGLAGDATLDSILAKTPIPDDFDVLSIDIDGCDYHIFQSITKFHPKLIVIEYNPTIPNDVAFVQPGDFAIKQGASAKSMVDLATNKGYSLVAVTMVNLFFVRNDFRQSVLGSTPVSLDLLRNDADCKIYIFCGYDGTVLTSKAHIPIAWHGLQLTSDSFQQLPKYLRRYPLDYNPLQKFLFALFLLVRFPQSFCERVKRRLSRFR